MTRSLTIGKKMIIGFALNVSLTMTIGVGVFLVMTSLNRHADTFQIIAQLQRRFDEARYRGRVYAGNAFAEGRDNQSRERDAVFSELAECQRLLDRVAVSTPDAWVAGRVNATRDEIDSFSRAFGEYDARERRKAEIASSIDGSMAALAAHVAKGGMMVEDMEGRWRMLDMALKSYFDRESEHRLLLARQSLKGFGESFAEWRHLVGEAEAYRDIAGRIASVFDEVGKGLATHVGLTERQGGDLSLMASGERNLRTFLREIYERTDGDLQTAQRRGWWIIMGGVGLSLLLGLIHGLGMNASVTRVIRKASGTIEIGTREMVTASSEVAAASQRLAMESSRQASAVDEAASALEQLSAMSHRNTDNARQATDYVSEISDMYQRVSHATTDLVAAMERINGASHQTQGILKTINDIAFQTNLLAMNAAIEAAHAGDAGNGFAVVAQEVRNLANRSAQAARETKNLLTDTIREVGKGSAIVSETHGTFLAAARETEAIGNLIRDIAASSLEQSQGIDQVNLAVSEINRIAMDNSAGAEEFASSSEEMNAQTETILASVRELIRMVDGRATRAPRASGSVHHPREKRIDAHRPAWYEFRSWTYRLVSPPQNVFLKVRLRTKTEVFRFIGNAMAGPGADADAIASALAERENLLTTGIGCGLAIPHAQIPGLNGLRVALLTLFSPIPYEALDHQSVDVIFGILTPENTPDLHLRTLSAISGLCRDRATLAIIRAATDPVTLCRRIFPPPAGRDRAVSSGIRRNAINGDRPNTSRPFPTPVNEIPHGERT